MRFCPQCGKKGNFPEVLCDECNSRLLDTKQESIAVTLCSFCNSFLRHNAWKRYGRTEDIVESAIKGSSDAKVLLPSAEPKEGLKVNGSAEYKKDGKKRTASLTLLWSRCSRCRKRGTTYYEGILQLRNPNRKIMQFIADNVVKQEEKGVFIAEANEVPNGIDYYLTSKKYLNTLGKLLDRHFKGELKKSAQLFTRNRQTSKDVHRMTILFRVSDH